MMGANKGEAPGDVMADQRISGATHHLGQNIQARSSLAIDDRTARHQNYGQSDHHH